MYELLPCMYDETTLIWHVAYKVVVQLMTAEAWFATLCIPTMHHYLYDHVLTAIRNGLQERDGMEYLLAEPIH